MTIDSAEVIIMIFCKILKNTDEIDDLESANLNKDLRGKVP